MSVIEIGDDGLLKMSRTAAQSAYCPYSHFPVGAAVDTEKGVFFGCNIENASYGLAVCAERVAIFSAVAAGARNLRRLAVSCPAADPNAPPGTRMPCGACRQVIAEFMQPDGAIVVDGSGVWSVADLLPSPFRLAVTDTEEEESSF